MAKLMSDTITETGVAAGSSKMPEKKGGMFEGLRKRKEAKRVFELVNSAASADNGSSRAKIQSAVELFKTMEREYQEKTLGKLEDLLVDAARYPFENDTNPRQIHVIADFLTAIVPYLPKDASGDPATEQYGLILKSLANVADNCDPEGNHKNYPHVVQACTKALWELSYPSFEFWEDRVRDPVTQEFTVAALLDMPLKDGQDPGTHGWHLLKSNLAEVGPIVLASSSPKKTDFVDRLDDLLQDRNPKTVKLALGLMAAVHLGSIPQKLVDLNNPVVKEFWEERIRDREASAPLTQQAAIGVMLDMPLEGTKNPGWSLLRMNLKHIVIPMALLDAEKKVAFLKTAVKSDNPAIAKAAFQIVSSLKPIPGEIITLAKQRKEKAECEFKAAKEAREGLLGSLRSALTARHTDPAKRQEARDAIGIIRAADKARDTDPAALYPASLLASTSEFLDMVALRTKIAAGGGKEIDGMTALLKAYSRDQGARFAYMAPFIINKHEKAMKDVLSGKLEQQEQAIHLLTLYETWGVKVHGRKDAPQQVVDKLLDQGPEAWYGFLKAHLGGLAYSVLMSRSEMKIDFLKAMAGSNDRKTSQTAFDIVLALPEIPEDFHKLATAIRADESRSASHLIADDFLHNLSLLELVDMGNGDQFKAVLGLINKYHSGRSDLHPLMQKLAAEMVDIVRDPGGSTEDEKVAQRLSALDMVVALFKSGIKVQDQGSVLQNIGAELVEILKDPQGSTPEAKEAQVRKALDVIGTLVMNGIKIPGVEVEIRMEKKA